MTEPVEELCTCGHMLDTHLHFRRGADCGICGSDLCPRFTSSSADPAATGGVAARLQRLVRRIARR